MRASSSWRSWQRTVYSFCMGVIFAGLAAMYARKSQGELSYVPALTALHLLATAAVELLQLPWGLVGTWTFLYIWGPMIAYLCFLKPLFSAPNMFFFMALHSTDGVLISGGLPLAAMLAGSSILGPCYAAIDFQVQGVLFLEWMPRGLLLLVLPSVLATLASLCQGAKPGSDGLCRVWDCLSPLIDGEQGHGKLSTPVRVLSQVTSAYQSLEQWILNSFQMVNTSWMITLLCVPLVVHHMSRAMLYMFLYGDDSVEGKLPPSSVAIAITAALCIGRVEFGPLLQRISGAEALLNDLLPPKVVASLLHNDARKKAEEKCSSSPKCRTSRTAAEEAASLSVDPLAAPSQLSTQVVCSSPPSSEPPASPFEQARRRHAPLRNTSHLQRGRRFSDCETLAMLTKALISHDIPSEQEQVLSPLSLAVEQLQEVSLPLHRRSIQSMGGALLGSLMSRLKGPQLLRDSSGNLGNPEYAEWHPDVTLLFADIKGFTEMCQQVEPQAVMKMLNELYNRFDGLTTFHPIYKVETIGDCYFAASGLLHDDPDHADSMLKFAQDMMEQARQVEMPGGGKVRIRVGIHSGRVMSGVVGRLRRRYCLFGDTVNTASRMESTGMPGTIQVSQATYERLKVQLGLPFVCRGPVYCKGKGKMMTYMLGQEALAPKPPSAGA